jgi:beta-galactosidase
LILNGKSLGERPVRDRYDPTLRWDVPNEPGTLRIVGKRDGKEAAQFDLTTAGAAHHILLTADRTELAAKQQDLSHVTIQIVDAEGRRVARSDAAVEVQVSGQGELAALDTGDLRDITPTQSPKRKVYEGRALAMVRAGAAGSITVRVSAEGLPPATFTLNVK